MPSLVPYILGPAFAVGLLLLALWFAWRQWRTLAWLRTQQALPADDQAYHRRMAWRRWLGCLLLAALAVMFAGFFGMGILEGLDDLLIQGDQAKLEGRKLTPEQREFVYFSMKYVGTLVLLLFGLLVVAFLDVMAIRKFGNRHRKRIRDDRAAMLERQLPELYRERRARGDGPPAGPPEPSVN